MHSLQQTLNSNRRVD